MSERAKNKSVVILGIVTAVVTLFIQVVRLGEVKGSIDTVIIQHERQLKDHTEQINGLNKGLNRIEGHLGINAGVSKNPQRNVASQPGTSGPYSTP